HRLSNEADHHETRDSEPSFHDYKSLTLGLGQDNRMRRMRPGNSHRECHPVILSHSSCTYRSFSANNAVIRFHESSSAALSYFMPARPCLSASATVKLC